MANETEVTRLNREIDAAAAASPRDEAKLRNLRDQLAAAQKNPDPGTSPNTGAQRDPRSV